MTLYFVRWPMESEAGTGDDHPICSQCEDDWVSLDDPESAIIKPPRQQRRCPLCRSWIDPPGATNAL
jgi:hypothetical protein